MTTRVNNFVAADVQVVLRPNYSTFIFTRQEPRRLLWAEFAVYQPGYKYSNAYKRGSWDGKVRFFGWGNNILPTGLIPTAIDRLKKAGYTITIDDNRRPIPQFIWPNISLREYQTEAVQAILDCTLFHGDQEFAWPAGVIQLPTGAGKTHCLVALAKGYQGRVLILVHRRELLHQISKVMRTHLHEEIGRLGDNIRDIKRVTVATVGTACRADPSLFQNIDVLLQDEVHHASADTHQAILRNIPATVRVGVSATPFREDPVQEYRVVGAYGCAVYKLHPTDLVADGVTAPVTVQYAPIREPNILPDSRRAYDLRWQDAYTHLIIRHAKRNEIIRDWVNADPEEPTLVIVNRVEHGEILSTLLDASFMTGEEPTKVRMAALQALHDRKITVLIGTTIFDEGIDVPAIRRVVLAAGGKSEVQVLQRIGRGVRKERATDTLTVLDFYDMTNKYLIKHSRERMSIAKDAGYAQETLHTPDGKLIFA